MTFGSTRTGKFIVVVWSAEAVKSEVKLETALHRRGLQGCKGNPEQNHHGTGDDRRDAPLAHQKACPMLT